MEISIYDNARDVRGESVELLDVLKTIRSDKALKLAVTRIRECDSEKTAKRLKEALPGATFSGRFTTRDALNLVEHSGLIVADVDHLKDKREAEKLRDAFADDEACVAAFVSPRAQGVKALFAVDDCSDHLAAWHTVNEHILDRYMYPIDESGKDVCRLCFLSWDPDVFIAAPGTVVPLRASASERHDSERERGAASAWERAERILPDVDIVEARRVLEHIDPGCVREQWLTVAIGLSTQFGNDNEAARELFVLWSRGDMHGARPDNFTGEKDVRKTWDSLKDPDSVQRVTTFRSVMRLAYDNGMPTRASAAQAEPEMRKIDAEIRERFVARIRKCNHLSELVGKIAEDISKTDMFASTRAALVDQIRKRHLALSDSKIDKATVDKATRFRAADYLVKDGCPPWAAPWVFVNADRSGSWYNRTTDQIIEPGAFDRTYQSECLSPFERAQGNVVPAVMPTALLVGGDLVTKVAGIRYMPGLPEFFEPDDKPGMTFVNKYKPDLIVREKMPEDWTAADEEAVVAWREHLQWMLPKGDAALLVQFLAFIAQRPGDRIGWAYLIQGPEGIGKTVIARMMRKAIGNANVNVISSSTLSHKQFNEWAEGAQLGIVEELYIDGAAKWDVMNVLKPVITNDVIDIHPKGKKSHEARNVTSYLMFTNHRDALPLADGDRRYFISETTHRERKDYIADLGGEAAMCAYYDNLVRMAEEHAPALRGWLLTVSIGSFDQFRPPRCEAKEALIKASRSDLEVAIDDVIGDANVGTVTREVVEIEALKAAIDLRRPTSGQELGRMLRRMGYDACGDNIMVRVPGRSREEMRKSRWMVHPIRAKLAGVDVKGIKPQDVIVRLLGRV